MREKIIQEIYDYLVNEASLSEEISAVFDSITEQVEKLSNIEESELVGNKLCHLEHAAFKLDANAILDFISGKEVA